MCGWEEGGCFSFSPLEGNEGGDLALSFWPGCLNGPIVVRNVPWDGWFLPSHVRGWWLDSFESHVKDLRFCKGGLALPFCAGCVLHLFLSSLCLLCVVMFIILRAIVFFGC